MKLRDMLLDEAFRTRLVSGRGTGEFVIRYRRGFERSHGGDDGESGAGIARIDACLDEMEAVMGLSISNSCVFCSEPRTVATVHFEIPGSTSEIVTSYDSVKRSFGMEILHPDQIDIEHPSLVDLAMAHSEPDGMIDRHFEDAAEAEAVRRTLRDIGCRPAPPAGEETSYQTYSLAIEAIG